MFVYVSLGVVIYIRAANEIRFAKELIRPMGFLEIRIAANRIT
jgi:hypothetical protein